MKHEYLIDLLKNNKTVIIPNIGAISNSDSPAHQYIFNEYLKFDDGMIVKYISTKEGKSLDDAGDDLDKFTQGFSDLLNQGKEVVIPQIGILSKVDGKTVFHCDTNVTSGTKVSTSSVEEKKEEPIVEKKEDPVVEKKPDPVIEKKPEPVVEKKPEPVVEKKPDPVIEKKPEPVVEIKPEPVIEIKPEPVIEKKIEPVIEKKVEPTVEKKEKKKEKKEKKPKKKRKLVWIILIIVLLGGGGTAGFIFKDQLMEMMGMSETTASNEDKKESGEKSDTKEESEELETSEEIPVDETSTEVESESIENNEEVVTEIVEEPVSEEVVEEPVVEEVKAPVQVASSSPGNYYIIVGCYSNQGNADNMISKVTAAGMSPTNVGTFNSLIHIAAGSASDMQGALQQLNAVKGTFPSAWIMKQ